MKTSISKTVNLIEKYKSDLLKNSNSLNYALLAEIYRKIGMLDEAKKVLHRGLSRNGGHLYGHLVLGKCFFDEDRFGDCYRELLPFVKNNLDNIVLQKYFGLSCLKIGKLEESLNSFKYLLFLHPKNKEFQKYVHEIEEKVEKHIGQITLNIPHKESDPKDWKVQQEHVKEEGPSFQLVDFYISKDKLDLAEDIIQSHEKNGFYNEEYSHKIVDLRKGKKPLDEYTEISRKFDLFLQKISDKKNNFQ